MCYPASFVVTKSSIYWSRYTESHSEIIKEYNIRETDIRGRPTLVNIELLPQDGNLSLPLSKWEYHVDQDILPPWYDAERIEKRVRKELPKWKKAKVVGPGKVLFSHTSGQVFVWGGAVEGVHNSGVVELVAGGGVVRWVFQGGRVHTVVDGFVECVDGGTVHNVADKGRVKKIYNGTIESVCNGGIVEKVSSLCFTSSTLEAKPCPGPAGVVKKVHGGTIKEVCGGVVLCVQPGSTIGRVCKGSTVITYTPLLDCEVQDDGVLINRSEEKKAIVTSPDTVWKRKKYNPKQKNS